MTDEQTEHLRSQVPDDPIPLPPDAVACEACGVAVSGGQRCSECVELHTVADRYVAEHPALVARLGSLAVARIESVLIALRVLNVAVPDDLGFMLPRFWPVAMPFPAPEQGSWGVPEGKTVGEQLAEVGAPVVPAASLAFGKRGDTCNPHPFAHVSLSRRADLRKAYAAVLADRVALGAPPVAIRCPAGACLMCGVTTVKRSAIEVARRGGPQAVAATAWHRVNLEKHSGYACASCALAIDEAGSVGPSAMRLAVLAHVQSTMGDGPARSLRFRLDDGSVSSLPMWTEVRGQRVTGKPFGHLMKVLDSLPYRRSRHTVGPMEEVPG